MNLGRGAPPPLPSLGSPGDSVWVFFGRDYCAERKFTVLLVASDHYISIAEVALLSVPVPLPRPTFAVEVG